MVAAPGAVAQPRFVGDALRVDGEFGEWFQPHELRGEQWFALSQVPGESRPDWLFGWRWSANQSRGEVVASVLRSRTRYGRWNAADRYEPLPDGPEALSEVMSVNDDLWVLAATATTDVGPWRLRDGHDEWEAVDGPAERPRLSARPVVRTTDSGTPFVWHSPEEVDDPHESTDRPGLVVMIHSGPTAYSSLAFSWQRELACQLGFAVACVDYRGSTSYGRRWRRALEGHWGRVDVEDVRDVIAYLSSRREIDAERIFTRGVSAGALSALLASVGGLVRGVVVVSGVSDPRELDHAGPEVEDGYTATLLGTRHGHDGLDELSPVARVHELAPRVLLIHGTADEIVPFAHSTSFADALRQAGKDVTLVGLEGEGHRLRGAAALRKAVEAEVGFYLAEGGAIR
jgi:acetyl esterase/lipase